MIYTTEAFLFNPHRLFVDAKIEYLGKTYECEVEEVPPEPDEPVTKDLILCDVPVNPGYSHVVNPTLKKERTRGFMDKRVTRRLTLDGRSPKEMDDVIDLSGYTNLKSIILGQGWSDNSRAKIVGAKCKYLVLRESPDDVYNDIGLETLKSIDYKHFSFDRESEEPLNPPLGCLRLYESDLESLPEDRRDDVKVLDVLLSRNRKDVDVSILPNLEKLDVSIASGHWEGLSKLLGQALDKVRSLKITECAVAGPRETKEVDLSCLPNLEKFKFNSYINCVKLVNAPPSLRQVSGEPNYLTELPSSVSKLKVGGLSVTHKLDSCALVMSKTEDCNVSTIVMKVRMNIPELNVDNRCTLTIRMTNPWKTTKSGRK
jgi:hypothetical protein